MFGEVALKRGKVRFDVLRNVRPGVECPFCGNRFWFWVTDRRDGRHETLCRRCGSLERHRRTILFLRQASGIYRLDRPALRLLHVAPEPCLQEALSKIPKLDTVTGDISGENVDVRLDLTRIQFSTDSFDVIVCSHVLEHIPDDFKAMTEMRRVLKREGWALINVPADPQRSTSYEDASITSRAERLAHFDQEDHVRVYAVPDVVERLGAAGFSVSVDPVKFTRTERRRYMLDGDIGWDHSYLCRPVS